MPASLTIRNIPDETLARLRERAARNHRSLQGETMAILEEILGTHRITVDELSRRVQERGLRTPSGSVAMIREDRNAR